MLPSAPTVAAPRTAGRSARSGTRDLFVLCAMAVVVLALGLGLHLQFNVSGQTALIAALVVWMALLVVHLAVRRAHGVVKTNAAEAPGNGVDLKRMPVASGPQPRAEKPEEPPLRSRPPPLPASARAPAPQQAAARLPRDASQGGGRASPDIQPPQPEAGVEERRLPPEMGWDLRPGSHRKPPASTPRPAVFPTLEQPAAAPAIEKEPAPGPARFPRHEPALDDGGRAPLRAEAPLGGSEISPDRLAPLTHSYPAARFQAPAGQAAQVAGAQADARGAEQRSMQSIIDQLARQLRAPAEPEAGAAAGMADTQAGTEQAIARSIEALKAAGGAMRAAQGGALVGGASREPLSAAEADRSAGDGLASQGYSLQGGAPPVAEAAARESLEVCLDSILSLEDRKTRHFEMSVRMRLGAGESVAIDDYALVQAGDGLRGRLDAAKLSRVARIAGPLSKRGLSAALFVSLAAESLVDDTFLDACAGVITSQPDIVHQLVPSFSQGEIRSFTKPHWETLATLRENGLRFGLERLADLAMDFAILRERGFHFVKIDAGMLLAGMQAHDGVVSALQVCQRVADAGLDLIVGRIEDDATLAQVGGLGVVYGQGTFFGVPRPVKVDLKASHEAAA